MSKEVQDLRAMVLNLEESKQQYLHKLRSLESQKEQLREELDLKLQRVNERTEEELEQKQREFEKATEEMNMKNEAQLKDMKEFYD